MPDVIGLDHIYIAVADLERSRQFYDRVFGVLGFRQNAFELGGDPHVQYYNRHFGYVLRPARGTIKGSVGLHHLCFRVATAADVERCAAELVDRGISASAPKLYPEYAPDYMATFLADPDGLRLEITNWRAERRHRHDHWEDDPTA